MHPNSRYVYVGNRASDTVDFEGKKVFPGGENSIAVFAIDQSSGEPTLIQSVDTRRIHALRLGGRWFCGYEVLVAALRSRRFPSENKHYRKQTEVKPATPLIRLGP